MKDWLVGISMLMNFFMVGFGITRFTTNGVLFAIMLIMAMAGFGYVAIKHYEAIRDEAEKEYRKNLNKEE